MIDRKDVPVLMSNMDKDSELSQFFNEYWKFVKEFLNGKEEQREKEKTITGRKSKIVCERLPQTITIADDGNTGDYLYDYLLLYANLWIDHCV